MTDDRRHELEAKRFALAGNVRLLAEQVERASVTEPYEWTQVDEAVMSIQDDVQAIYAGITTA